MQLEGGAMSSLAKGLKKGNQREMDADLRDREELAVREERLRLAMMGSRQSYWDWRIGEEELFVSECFCHLVDNPECKPDTIRCIRKLMVREDWKLLRQSALELMQGSNDLMRVEIRLKAGGEQWKWISVRGSVVTWDEAGRPLRIAGMLTDIDQRKKWEEEVRYLSFHDKLTGLSNRVFFEKELENVCTAGPMPYALILGDLNGLKLTNDAFGHHEGDKLLTAMAGVLKECCRSGDIIARWGGDEFAIILKSADDLATKKVCNRIREACNAINSCAVKPSIALGYAVWNKAERDKNRLIKEAEERMYRNKLKEGRKVRNNIILSMGQRLAEKKLETAEHTMRIRSLCVKFGNILGLKDEELEKLALLAVLHDIGKVAIPDEILLKPGALSTQEWSIIKQHSEIGYRIAHSTPEIAQIAEGILTHHECYDGSGYPNRLKGSAIPLISRILAIAEAFDVMTKGTFYKKPLSMAEALHELKQKAGTQFDPTLVIAFTDFIRKDGDEF